MTKAKTKLLKLKLKLKYIEMFSKQIVYTEHHN